MIWLARHRMLPRIKGDRGLLPMIHVDDAVSATVAALYVNGGHTLMANFSSGKQIAIALVWR